MSMEAVATKPAAFEVEDVEYLRHGDKPLFIRCYRPHGAGPFPVLIELHGGVWTENDRTRGKTHHEGLRRTASRSHRSISGRAPPAIRTR